MIRIGRPAWGTGGRTPGARPRTKQRENTKISVRPIPDGFHGVTPYLLVPGIPKLIDSLEKAFDSQVTECVDVPDGTVTHAQVKIVDSIIMMGNSPCPTRLPGGPHKLADEQRSLHLRNNRLPPQGV